MDKTKNIGRDIHISRDFNGEKSCSPKTSFEWTSILTGFEKTNIVDWLKRIVNMYYILQFFDTKGGTQGKTYYETGESINHLADIEAL